MAVKFLWKPSPEINLLNDLVTIVTVINVVISKFSWKDLQWLAHETVRLQNIAVYAPIRSEEFVIDMIHSKLLENNHVITSFTFNNTLENTLFKTSTYQAGLCVAYYNTSENFWKYSPKSNTLPIFGSHCKKSSEGVPKCSSDNRWSSEEVGWF